ncbi:MAG: primosomal protein N' [Brachymonas sp.]|nr:primosomal protein N' [Brachymonas sp.]
MSLPESGPTAAAEAPGAASQASAWITQASAPPSSQPASQFLSASHSLLVLVALPAHSPLSATPLHYLHHAALPPGTLVRVPLGQRSVLGVVWQSGAEVQAPPDGVQPKPILEAFTDLPPLDASWRELVAFVARYYQRSLGEVALAALPPPLRELDGVQLARRLKKLMPPAAKKPGKKAKAQSQDQAQAAVADGGAAQAAASAALAPAIASMPAVASADASTDAALDAARDASIPATAQAPALTAQQEQALAAVQAAANETTPPPLLLFGNTGSGKTEVYLQAVAQALAHSEQAQVLVLVPEINLTPQLEQRFAARFAQQRIVALHSGMTPAQRLQGWLAAHTGLARIVLGTRMAVLASMPHLRLIVVDEEHDPSYKQQEGARYSARDLAIYRARQVRAPVLLGSATPSLESWHHSRPPTAEDAGGRYRRLCMPERMGAAALPAVRLIDMAQLPRGTVCSPALLEAVQQRAARGEQSLLLLNRRGYAPVLHCPDCGWKSQCPHCSAFRVFHKIDRSLRCHHCGYTVPVPRACPDCGNQDIRALGLGTEQLEEALQQQLQTTRRPDGSPLRVLRIDADTTRLAGSLAQQLAQAHSGEVDVLVGTQMLAKGHDFRRITLVAALNPDTALFSSDFRAPERLFALLMQAGGRAGRDAALSTRSELWVQTGFITHPLFAALRKHDYPGFAQQQLEERRAAGMPPFSYQALIRAEAREQQAAQDFLNSVRMAAEQWATTQPEAASVLCYPAVPMVPQRIANRERAQMLIESDKRPALQGLLPLLGAWLHQQRTTAILRWAVDVDPLAV